MAKKKKKKKSSGARPPTGTQLPKMAQDVADIARGGYAAQPWLLKAQQEFGGRFGAAEAMAAGDRSAEEAKQIQRNWGATEAALMESAPYREATENFRATTQASGRIFGALAADAEEELALGGQLTGDEQREASQASRSAWNDRGLVTSGRSAVDEVLARVSMSNARKRERQAFAGQVAAQGTALSTQQMGVAASQFDPYQRIFGTGGSQVTGTLGSDQLFTPYAGPAVDIYTADKNYAASMAQLASAEKMQKAGFAHDTKMTQMNAKYSADIAAGNNAAARSAARTQAVGAAVGAGVGVAAAAIIM